MPHLHVELDDDITVTDLRGETWPERLVEAGKLRVQRRGQTVGVLLSPQEWRALRQALGRYEALFDRLEEDGDRRLISEREEGVLGRGPTQAQELESELARIGLLR